MDRRNFLKELGTIGTAGIALSLFPWLEACSTQADKQTEGEKASLAVIGTGSRGLYHLNNLLKMSNARVVALCDNYKPNLDAAAALFPEARTYDDYRKMLENKDIQGVIIATPLHLHAQMTIDALDCGKGVLCEKAMAYTMDDCLKMYQKSKTSGKVLMVGQQRLFDPKYIKAMESIRRGELGQVVNVRNYWYRNNDWRRPVPSPELERHINWRLYREYSRGLMTELACHQLQNGTWAMRMLPEKVTGTGNIVYWKDGREVFDSVSIIYTFPNGVNMTFESVIANKHFGLGEHILCSEGTVNLAQGRIYGEKPAYRSGIRQFIDQIEKGVLDNSAFAGTSWSAENGSSDKGIIVMPEAVGDGSVEMLTAFCNSVIRGVQPAEVLEEAYYASIFCLLGDEAMLQKSILTLPEEFKIAYI